MYSDEAREAIERKILTADEDGLSELRLWLFKETCRLENGALTGSAAKLCHILGKEIRISGIDVVTAINSCTCNPMNMLGFGNVKGYIKQGYDADITVRDGNFDAIQTYVGGVEML